jgi:hypothetical protein
MNQSNLRHVDELVQAVLASDEAGDALRPDP